MEPGSSLADDPTITQLFVEYQFLTFNYGDLETVTVAKPPPGQSVMFNLKTGVVKLFSITCLWLHGVTHQYVSYTVILHGSISVDCHHVEILSI